MTRFEKQTDYFKYGDLIDKKHSSNKPYFLISELIDNSISNWEKYKKEDEQLNIFIEINLKKSTLICVDNAYGMNQKGLEESIIQNKYKEGNEFNKFGVGMKNCAFWFGKDLEIWTKSSNEKLYTSVLCSKYDRNDKIEWICELDHEDNDDLKIIDRGTKIKISNCHDGRLPRRADVAEIREIIARKYYHWLINGVKILINWYDGWGNKHEQNENELLPSKIKSQIIKEDLVDHFIASLERINSFYLLDEEKIKEITNNAKKGKPIEFSLEKKIGEKGPFVFKFGVQEQQQSKREENITYKKLYGIGTLQKNRYINIPNVNVIEHKSWDYTRGDIKRMWGQVDFGNSFELDNNKKNFDFKDDITSWEEFLVKIGKDMEKICNVVKITLTSTAKIDVKNHKKEKEKIVENLNRKTNFDDNYLWNLDGNEEYTSLKILDYKFKLCEKSFDPNQKEYFFINTFYPEDKVIEIHYNINHNVLKPLVQNVKTDFEISFYPIIITLGINFSYMDNKLKSGGLYCWLEEFGKDYTNILNELLDIMARR